jgi:hypothetical protein
VLLFIGISRFILCNTSMPQAIRYTLISIRDLMVSFGPFIAFGVLLLGLAYWWLDPNPPKVVTLATGPAQSAYDEFSKKSTQSQRHRGAGGAN